MFLEFGPAPLCLELNLDSYDGPWQHVWRFRNRSGWLLVARATIQSADHLITRKLVVACDEHEVPIPGFQAVNLTKCTWRRPSECMEFPPAILDDLLCEEEGALVAQWHREQNSALMQNYEERMERIDALEGRVAAIVSANDRRITELRRRRRLASGNEAATTALTAIIDDLERENEQLIGEMSQTRSEIRSKIEQDEERLWRRTDLLLEVEPLHQIRWNCAAAEHSPEIARPTISYSDRSSVNLLPGSESCGAHALRLAIAKGRSARYQSHLLPIAEEQALDPRAQIAARIDAGGAEMPSEDESTLAGPWTDEAVRILKLDWLRGASASQIAKHLGSGFSRNSVIGKAKRLRLPQRHGLNSPTATPSREQSKALSYETPSASLSQRKADVHRAATALRAQSRQLLMKPPRDIVGSWRFAEKHERLDRRALALRKRLEAAKAPIPQVLYEAITYINLAAALFAERAVNTSAEQ